MIVGTLLVLLTWMLGLIAVITIGLAVTRLVSRTTRSTPIDLAGIRVALWWGLAFTVIVILFTNLGFPLASAGAAGVIGIVFLLAAAFLLIRPAHISLPRQGSGNRGSRTWAFIATYVALAGAVIYLAFAALGPVTNYDSGLYHLGAIRYAADYSTISGLANLYFPLGYNTSLYPFAAFLGNGPWGVEGYRLANGFIATLVVLDLILRLVCSRGKLRRLSGGSWILLIATFIGLVPLVALSDYWVTSPSSDAPVMMLTFVASAYLADGIFRSRNRARDLTTSFIVSVILFSLRPTMAVFLVGVTLVIATLLIRRRTPTTGNVQTPLFVAAAVLGAIMLGVQSIRDYFLSGWLQYPLSLFSFATPWTATDPVWNRTATLGNARNPADIWGSVDGYSWVGAWVSRLPSQWETYLLFALVGVLITVFIVNRRSHTTIRWRALALAVFPSALASVAWFLFSPPSFRFGWGPVFSLLIIPVSFGIYLMAQQGQRTNNKNWIPPIAVGLLTVGLLGVIAYSGVFRLAPLMRPQPAQWEMGSVAVTYQATPVVAVPVQPTVLSSGLEILVPLESDQCWENFPLCTPIISESVRLQGDTIQQGFLP